MATTGENKEVAIRLRAVRDSFNETQTVFAERLGMKMSAYAQVEAGRNGVSTRLMQRLKEGLRVSPDWLMSGHGNMFLGAEHPASASSILAGLSPSQLEAVESIAKVFRELNARSAALDAKLKELS